MHLDSLISSSSPGNHHYYHHTYLGADSALSPDHMASCSPCLISPYPAGISSTMVNSPVSPPIMSPTTNSFITNDVMEPIKVFQFPPPSHLQSNSNLPHILPPTTPANSNPPLNTIKQEEWNLPCLQDNLHNPSNLHLDHDEHGRIVPTTSGPQTSHEGLHHLCFPSVATTTSLLQQPDQGSPMAISPASLNTPRGSITSFRSRSQQNSPMNMDSAMTTFTSLAPTSGAAPTAVSASSCTTSCATTATLSSLTHIDMLNEISASFTVQVPTSSNSTDINNSCSTSNIIPGNNPGAHVTSLHDDTMLPSFHGNEAFNEGENTQYISYTMLQPSLMAPTSAITNANLEQHQLQHKFPSPPGSGYSSPVHTMAYSQNYQHQNATSHNNPPPSYEDFMNSSMTGMPMGNDGTTLVSNTLGHNITSTNPANVLNSNEIHDFFNEGVLKTEPGMDIPHNTILQTAVHHESTKSQTIASGMGSIPDHDSLFTSDTCPETPDSSVKEEIDVNSPDTGSYLCLWLDCNEEFDNPKTYVDHVNESHMETRKGCEEFPCLWKVNINHLIRSSYTSVLKYNVIFSTSTHLLYCTIYIYIYCCLRIVREHTKHSTQSTNS